MINYMGISRVKRLKGIPLKGRIENWKTIWIPYLEVIISKVDMSGRNKIWIDAYFIDKISKIERRAALIKRIDENIRYIDVNVNDIVLEPSVNNATDIFYALHEAYFHALKIIKTRGMDRIKRISKWSLLRVLMIPSGYRRYINQEERESLEMREALWSYEILRKVFMIKTDDDWYKCHVEGGEICWYPFLINKQGENIEVRDGGDKDLKLNIAYTTLTRVDDLIRKIFMELIKS